ncbi:MAG: cobalamin-binding protein [candidate division WOR-3 bacterium]
MKQLYYTHHFALQNLLILFLLISWLASCSQPTLVTPKRVVSLVPSITEIIFALGCEANLVGNTVYCDYPPEAQKIYKVGDFSNPSLEKILALKPDIVFATMPEQKIIIERLKELKIRVFISQPITIDSMFQEIRTIGKILGRPERGESLATTLAKACPAGLGDIPVYLEIAQTPLMTVGGSSFINDVISRAGGKNIFADVSQEYPIIDQEEVIKRNPAVIFILHPQAKKEEVKKRLGWQEIAAIKNNKVYDDVNPDLIFRPGPRIVQGISALAMRIKNN